MKLTKQQRIERAEALNKIDASADCYRGNKPLFPPKMITIVKQPDGKSKLTAVPIEAENEPETKN